MKGSLPFNISKSDLEHALKGLFKYLLGAFLVYVGMQVQHVDFGQYNTIVMSLAGFLIDVGHKYFVDTTV